MIYEIVHCLDSEGRKIVVVPVKNSDRKVQLLEGDFDELEALGCGLPWKWNQEQVLVRDGTQDINVARLIVDAQPGYRVSFENNNPTDLRRHNLVILPGPAQYRARDLIQRVHRFKRNSPQIRHVSQSATAGV
jgi:hypothetical protein